MPPKKKNTEEEKCIYCGKSYSALKQHYRDFHRNEATRDGVLRAYKRKQQNKSKEHDGEDLSIETLFEKFSSEESYTDEAFITTIAVDSYKPTLVLSFTNTSNITEHHKKEKDLQTIDNCIQRSSETMKNLVDSLNFMHLSNLKHDEVKTQVNTYLQAVKSKSNENFSSLYNDTEKSIDIIRKIENAWSNAFEEKRQALLMYPEKCYTSPAHLQLFDRVVESSEEELNAELIFLEALYFKAMAMKVSKYKCYAGFLQMIKECFEDNKTIPMDSYMGLSHDDL